MMLHRSIGHAHTFLCLLCAAAVATSTSSAITDRSAGKLSSPVVAGLHRAPQDERVEIADVTTSAGTFEIVLHRNRAPRAVQNFVRLAERGYFNGSPVLYVVRDSIVLLGDPTGTGAGGESVYGRTFPDEASSMSARGYRRGMVAMAHGAAPNSNTSTFFIALRDLPIPPAYTHFGTVARGLDVIDRIGSVDVLTSSGGKGGRPREDVTIMKISIRTIPGSRR